MDHRSATDYDALGLRLGEAEVPCGPADVAAFASPLDADDAADVDAEDEVRLLLVAAGLVGLRPGLRVIPLGEVDGEWPIPAPEPVPQDMSLETWSIPTPEPVPQDMSLETWSIRPVHEERVAMIAAGERRRSPSIWRPLVVAAVSLPLIAGTGEVWAAPSPAVQRPTSAPATTTTATTTATTVDEPPPPTLPEEPIPMVSEAPEDAPQGGEATAPTAAAETGTGVPESHFAAMRGLEVSLTFARGGRRKGRLVSTDGPDLLFVDFLDEGRLVNVPKSEVLELRGVVPSPGGYLGPDPTMPTGTGMLVTGAIGVALGTPFFITGAAFLGFSSPSLGLIFFIPGLVGLGAGIPLLVFGARRRKAYRASALRTARLTPAVTPTRGGWTGSLTLRF